MNDKRGIKPLPELHITLKFHHDGTFAGAAGWSWRAGRCSRNGMVVMEEGAYGPYAAEQAVIAGQEAYADWLANGGNTVIP